MPYPMCRTTAPHRYQGALKRPEVLLAFEGGGPSLRVDRPGWPWTHLECDMFPPRTEGQGLAEYALILSLIAILAISALLFLSGRIDTILSTIGKSL